MRFYRVDWPAFIVTKGVGMDKNEAPSTAPTANSESCCKVESVVTVDERGQMVLPKEVRRRAGIEAGARLVVISCENEGDVRCIILMKVEYLTDEVKGLLDSVIPEIL